MVDASSLSDAFAGWFYTIVLAWGAIAAAFVALGVSRAWNAGREWADFKAAHADNLRAIRALEKQLVNRTAASKELVDRVRSDLGTLRNEVALKPDRIALDSAIERVETTLSALAASSHAEAKMAQQALEGA